MVKQEIKRNKKTINLSDEDIDEKEGDLEKFRAEENLEELKEVNQRDNSDEEQDPYRKQN